MYLSQGADRDGQASAHPGEVDRVVDGDVPDAETIFGWIGEVHRQGIRRPGYPADSWAEDFCEEQFRRLGLQNVCREPVATARWEPIEWSLDVTPAGGATIRLECFPLPYTAPTDGLEVELAAYDPSRPHAVAGKASLYPVSLMRLPAALAAIAGSAPEGAWHRLVDPQGTLTDSTQVLPFGTEFQEVMEPSMRAGAAAFIGWLRNYPGDSCRYYVPYDGMARPLPAVWVRDSDGDWLARQLAAGPVHVRLRVASSIDPVECHNVVGELPGADDQTVLIGSHHDGPWSSAVEDASGLALVLAQAAYWAAQPVERRPHRLVFVVHAAHMTDGAGMHAYIARHRRELDEVVLQVHLEHAALEVAEDEHGGLIPTGRPEPRWFFTSRIPHLEAAVFDALTAERLDRSMLVAPDALDVRPPTDGGYYYDEGVPVVQFLAAPFYLFDPIDTLDKVDRDNLVPLTRATIRIVNATHGLTASDMRQADLLRG